eukprot:11795895-Alexandrium_andersonii.AAC.1
MAITELLGSTKSIGSITPRFMPKWPCMTPPMNSQKSCGALRRPFMAFLSRHTQPGRRYGTGGLM